MATFQVPNREDKGEFAHVPAGQYKTKIKTVSMESGPTAPYLKISMVVLEGLGVDNPEEFAGSPLQSRLSLSEKAQWKLNAFLDALGYSDNDQDFNTDDLVNRELFIQTTEGQYEGKPRTEVSGFSSQPRQQQQQTAPSPSSEKKEGKKKTESPKKDDDVVI